MSEHTASFSGWMPNGLKTYFTVELSGTADDFDKVLNYQNAMLGRGLALSDPAFGKLEAGEKTDTVGYVVRYDKENKHGNISHWIGLYPDSDEAVKKYLWVYLDTPEDIAEFEQATGVKVDSMEVWPTNQAPERSPSTMKFIVKVKPGTTVVYKINPEWSDDPKDKFVPKRIFVRWAAPVTQPQPSQTATPPAASGKAAEPDYAAIEAEERRKAATALDNEAVTIYKATYKQTHNGMGAPCWTALAHDINGASLPITVWEQQVRWIVDAGYTWPKTDGKDLNITVITHMVKGERLIKSVLKAEYANGSQKPLETPPSAKITYTVDKFTVNLSQKNTPYLIFAIGNEEYAYAFTRKPFEDAGYDVTTWKTVGGHEMPTPAEITVEMGKDGRFTVVAASMVDVFEKAAS